MHIHILGICGTFMGSLAALAKESGFEVTGSDLHCYPPISDQLDHLGIEVIPNYDPEQLKLNPDLIVVGNVMSRGMPIIETMLNSNIPFTSGPQWLGENILKDRTVIAVSGTHGKTTTSSLIAFILKDLGLDPGYLIGGVPIGFNTSASIGSHSYFIIEADEYDTAFFDKRSKFIHYHPNFLVLNNIEFDHADIFKDLDQILWQFHQLLRTLPSDTKIIANGEDKNINELFHQGVWSERILFGQSEQFNWSANADTHGSIRLLHEQATVAQINPQIIGDHNMMNILAAAATLSLVEIDESQMLESIERFPGVKRRLEFLGEFSGVQIYDDFAHHPTSIKASIHSLQAKFQESSVFTITELACNTMKKGALKAELLDSFDEADGAWIMNDKDIKWDIENQFASKKNVSIANNHDALSEELNGKVKPGDIILIMTNRSSVPIREALIDIFDS